MQWDPTQIRALRAALRLSQERFADHLGAAAKTVRNWERGLHPPSLALKRALDHAWESASDEQRKRFFASLTTSAPEGPLEAPELGDRVARVIEQRPGRIDGRLLDGLGTHATGLAGAFHALPAASLIGPAVEHLETIIRLTRSSMNHDQRRRLCALGADAATLGGWISLLLDRDADARAYLALGQALAHEAEDPALEAGVLGSMARACSPSLTWRGGDPAYALQLSERADALTQRAPALLRSWLDERSAIENACAGDTLASDHALHRARDTLDHVSDDSGLGGFLGRVLSMQDQWYLTTVEGLCHILLRRGDQAETALTAALAETSPTRTRLPIMLLGDLAAARVLQNQPEAATRALAECHSRALERAFAVGRQRVRNVRAQFPPSWIGLACVTELDEHISLGQR